MNGLPEYVEITEVGPRDGIQNETSFIPTGEKIQFIHLLNDAGFKRMEATSFVSPKHVPQMKDAAAVADRMERRTDTQYIALVPNQKGYEIAKNHNIDSINIVMGVSETFNQRNVRMSREDSLQQAMNIINDARGNHSFIRFSLATSFWCPFEGKIDKEEVKELVKKIEKLGVDEIDICDTIGRADPLHVQELFSDIFEILDSDIKITAHFHETYGFGQANVMAALQAGVTSFDAAAGGLGGCPFAPGAAGNLATEDLIYLLNSMGIKSNINLDKLLKAVDLVKTMTDRNLSGHIHQLMGEI